MIKIENISKSYIEGGRERVIFKNINIIINDGESIAIVGPSGTGKSTLLNLIAGLVDGDTGNIYVDDINIANLKKRDKLKLRIDKYGFIFQHFNLISSITCLDNILVPALAKTKKPDMDYIMSLVKKLEIESCVNKYPLYMSGGEQQRTAIARALVNKPQIILSDEATGNLDAENSENVMKLLDECRKEHGQIMIYVTHDESLCKYADRVIRVKRDGGISEEKTS